MGFFSWIKDGRGKTGASAGVTTEHALITAILPPKYGEMSNEILTRSRILHTFLVNNNGDKDLNIDGSLAPVEFKLSAEPGLIKIIERLRIILHSEKMEIDTIDFKGFGSSYLNGLTNGLELEVVQDGVSEVIFAEPVKNIGEFLKYTDSYTNIKNSVSSLIDFLAFDFIFDTMTILPEGTKDHIVMRINDDLTSIALFQVIVIGGKELL